MLYSFIIFSSSESMPASFKPVFALGKYTLCPRSIRAWWQYWSKVNWVNWKKDYEFVKLSNQQVGKILGGHTQSLYWRTLEEIKNVIMTKSKADIKSDVYTLNWLLSTDDIEVFIICLHLVALQSALDYCTLYPYNAHCKMHQCIAHCSAWESGKTAEQFCRDNFSLSLTETFQTLTALCL